MLIFKKSSCKYLLLLFIFLPSLLSAQELLFPLFGQSNYATPTSNFTTLHSVSVNSNSQYFIGSKSSTEAVKLPFFDDFSSYTGCPDNRFWSGCDALVNTDYSNHPLSVGMVTLDAVNAEGKLHTGANSGRFPGDTLCSRFIRLDSSFGSINRQLTPSDSVIMSFYYLPGGGIGNMWDRIGSTPGPEDSLLLEFWNPSSQQWSLIWASGGIFEDTLLDRTGHSWQYVVIPILNPDYLDSNFQFRFRNYCSLGSQADKAMLGNTDQWNIDYIRIDCNRSVLDECTRDISFVQSAPSLLRNCWAIPAHQFNSSSMIDQLSININNLYGEQLSVHLLYNIFDDEGRLLLSSDEGYDNIDPFRRNYSSFNWTPQISYTYPVDHSRNQFFDIEFILREGVSGDKYPSNDTIRLRQFVSNFYAYDDGTPENGYGVTSTSSKVYLACRFSLNTPDTLSALDLYFNQALDSANEEIPFRISVWADDNGKPGSLIFSDEAYLRPNFDGLNRYHRYFLSNPAILSGTVYIGLEQSTNKFISLGFDRNTDHHQDIYYLASGDWQQSVLSGSLMLRPCFGSSALVGISSPSSSFIYSDQSLQTILFPNPASDHFSVSFYTTTLLSSSSSTYNSSTETSPSPISSHCQFSVANHPFPLIASDDSNWQVILYDMNGREVLRSNYLDNIDISSLPSGCYLCRILNCSHPFSHNLSRLFINR